jgi:segregation and condensation protein A
LSLYELLKAYAIQMVHHTASHVVVARPAVVSIEEAIKRLVGMLGGIPDWTRLETFLPKGIVGAVMRRSAVASTFAASLEVAKQGKIRIRQLETFGPIYLRRTADAE